MRTVVSLLVVSLLALLATTPLQAKGVKGYYRYPSVHKDTIVFTAEGDLWTVPVQGGLARRLTTHLGQETHAAISPDGAMVAFSANYEGPREVYVMPTTGGKPERLTWHGDGAEVVGWTDDGRVLYRTRHFSGLPDWQLVLVDPETANLEQIPLAQAAQGVYGNGGTLFFCRQRRQSSWTKRYHGGTVQNIWSFARDGKEATNITADYQGTSSDPMWWKGRLYFTSDRDGIMNIWSMAPDGSDLQQHTHHRTLEVRSPSMDRGRIVYQRGADLYVLNVYSGADTPIKVTLSSDVDQLRERWIDDPMEYLTSTDISAEGDRVALTARGQVFVVPSEPGRLVEVTHDPSVRYRAARFMPDAKTIVALSDKTGELEFWQMPADGIGEMVQITDNGEVFRFQGLPSPDGKNLAFTDKNHKLWMYHLDVGITSLIAVSENGPIQDLCWSPDGSLLAYGIPSSNDFQQLFIYDVTNRENHPLTTDRTDNFDPAFSPDGRWVYFLSDRHLESLVPSPWGPRQPEPFLARTTEIFLVPLVPGLRSPFMAPDELHPSADDNQDGQEGSSTDGMGSVAGGGAGKRKQKNKKGVLDQQEQVDLNGLEKRLQKVPVPAGNYLQLSLTDKRLYCLSWSWEDRENHDLLSMPVNYRDPELEPFMESIRDYQLSANRKKLLVVRAEDLLVLDAGDEAPRDQELEDSILDLSGWTFSLDPREEWRQMFVEAWRLERDYFYDRDMHGVDWAQMGERYFQMLDRVTDREELADLMGQMVSELSALHTFVFGGDHREGLEDVQPGSLGARFKKDAEAGGWRIEHIYATDPDYPDDLSPLASPDVAARVGEVITAIDGVPSISSPDIGSMLRSKAGRQVRLSLEMGEGKEISTREVIVTPITPAQEEDLRYREWEYTRRLLTEDLGKGKIGYVHLRAMSGDDYGSWAREFYPVYKRQALIIDVRHNRGGNIDSWILEKLLRKAWFYWQPRVGEPWWNMQYAFRGHLVVLCDEKTASDGEAFTEGVKRLELGTVIGTRTWGGEIWLSGNNWLVDKGIATAAEYGVYGPEGVWLIEGHGVEPDIVIDNLPHSTFEGEDKQLQVAVEHLLDLMAQDPVPVPSRPPYPDKSFPGDPDRQSDE